MEKITYEDFGYNRPNWSYDRTNFAETGLRKNAHYLRDALAELAKDKEFILEIGLKDGDGSTKVFDQANPKLHIGIDIFDNFKDCPEDVQKKACNARGSLDGTTLGMYYPKNPNFKFLKGDSTKSETLKKCLEISNGKKPDLIYIDTVHYPDFLAKELKVWINYMKDTTVFAFHDVYDPPSWDGTGEFHGRKSELCRVVQKFADAIGYNCDFSNQVGKGIGIISPGENVNLKLSFLQKLFLR